MDFFNKFINIDEYKIPKEEESRIMESLYKIYPTGQDAWGLDLNKANSTLRYIWPLYKKYFKVRLFGKENIEDTPYIVVSNHSGQIAIDGALISAAFTIDTQPPRILRAMVERFVTKIPFFNTLVSEGGAVLGDRQNCKTLLEKGNSVLVFPEGVKGIAKNTNNFYQLQNFTRGFFRIAIKTKTPILPVAVVGAEEFYPFVYHPMKIAKKLGLPALPLTPNLIPLPSPVDIHIGNPIYIGDELDHSTSDSIIDIEVNKLRLKIDEMLKSGLNNRRDFWANKK